MPEQILATDNLTKRYGKILAVDKLSLNIKKGNVYGILGPNGSGKTTTLATILGVINATEGTYSWFDNKIGYNPRKKIGALLEQPNFYPYLTGYENLKIVAEIKNIPFDRIDEALKTVGLYERKQHKFKTYSLGMKQRLAIGSALLGDPEVLVLDEPTNGLDPQGIAEVRQLIIKVAETGKTIILASHILNEVEKVCTHVAVLKKGKLLAEGSVNTILAGGDIFEVGADNLDSLSMTLSLNPQVKSIITENGKLLIETENVTGAQINDYAHQHGVILSHIAQKKRSLEEHFIELINQDNDKTS